MRKCPKGKIPVAVTVEWVAPYSTSIPTLELRADKKKFRAGPGERRRELEGICVIYTQEERTEVSIDFQLLSENCLGANGLGILQAPCTVLNFPFPDICFGVWVLCGHMSVFSITSSCFIQFTKRIFQELLLCARFLPLSQRPSL